jgi:nicotinate-nucleotide pyrophosphorylase (carboxylating)
LDALLDLALAEDIGCGDVTSRALIPAAATARVALIAREPLVLCGTSVVDRLHWRFGPTAPTLTWKIADGTAVEAGTVVGEWEGRLHDILILERPALNFLQRMSGVATLTRTYVDAVAGTQARIVDTRKTLPGYRMLDKYATRVGGGTNHRASLDGGFLIKDNHLIAAGGIGPAVRTALAAEHSLRVEVEVEDLAGVDEALEAGAEVILLDNFTPAQLAKAAARIGDRAIIEASGGITLETVRAFAEAGAQLIAVGALTHSATAVDLAAEVVERA